MNLKTKSYLVLAIIFSILTFIGVYMVISHKLDNAGYSIVPMVFAIAFIGLYKQNKNKK